VVLRLGRKILSIKFGTDGWRGVIAEDFTFENLRRVARATALYSIQEWDAQEKGVVIGYDTRFLSPEGASIAANIIANEGIPVVLSQSFVPTPILSFSIKEGKRGGGVMITASHNPYIFNGFKIKTPQAGSAPPQATSRMETLLSMSTPPKSSDSPQNIKREDLTSAYLRWLQEAIDLRSIGKLPITIVSDAIHGAVGRLFYRILTPWGMKVEVMAGERNPLFGGRNPEPIEENLIPLIKQIKQCGGQAVGIAHDGDGDRVGMVDESGRFVSSHVIFAMVLEHLYNNKGLKGEVVKTFSTTSMIEKMGEDFGLTVHETSIGFKHILPLMLERDILVAGEESGGIGVKGHIPERDGIYSALLVFEKMAWENRGLSHMVEDLQKRYGPYCYQRRDLNIPQEKGEMMVERLGSAPPDRIGLKSVDKVIILDGIKLLFSDDGWLLFRASGTEPLLRLYCEGRSPEEVKSILDDGERIVRAIIR